MRVELGERVALVTGASRGIGLAIARALAQNGARVMLTARKLPALEEAAAEISGDLADAEGAGEVAVFAAHAGSPEGAEAAVAATVERFGGLDILVNNAATNPYAGPLIDIDLPRLDKTIEVNLRGPLVWTQAAWRARLREHGGTVLNIASIGGLKYGGPLGVYDMTKAALIYQTRHLATELGPGVRVNAIAPGLVQTDFARYLWTGAGPEADYGWALGRIGQPPDIASAALFLVSDAAAWITGEVLVVDGGSLLGPRLAPTPLPSTAG
ncbi:MULTISPECIES: SDR family oxidoreductase [Pseudofrankia]|uniref:SDR family oxidoreductase n=1 Tax=Pseudofrankia TaxID=2994363 RepID=UPI000234D942|nr:MULTISPECIES: SDR family oxidoreductase [Pseudofrankia]OHV41686.1 3-ketoacyl-ACP reductase [Pseudofrankia sp. EUN1h]